MFSHQTMKLTQDCHNKICRWRDINSDVLRFWTGKKMKLNVVNNDTRSLRYSHSQPNTLTTSLSLIYSQVTL